MARDNASRRLRTLLADEDFGPKLVRLRGEDEAHVLRLIEQNKGKEARAEILRLDEQRRTRQREARHARQQPRPIPKTTSDRSNKERRAAANILAKAEGRADSKRVRRNVRFMTIEELDFAADASYSDLIDRARRAPYTHTDSGDELNPFWYH